MKHEIIDWNQNKKYRWPPKVKLVKKVSRLTFGKSIKRQIETEATKKKRDHKNRVRVCVKAYLINKVIKIMCCAYGQKKKQSIKSVFEEGAGVWQAQFINCMMHIETNKKPTTWHQMIEEKKMRFKIYFQKLINGKIASAFNPHPPRDKQLCLRLWSNFNVFHITIFLNLLFFSLQNCHQQTNYKL